jgi:hypothetical protein
MTRAEYFRQRTDIGKLEMAAARLAARIGHTPKLIRDGREATSIGCFMCDAWGCAEIDGGELAHGSIFEVECGKILFNEDDIAVFAAALGGR